jgi:hypothetical protein
MSLVTSPPISRLTLVGNPPVYKFVGRVGYDLQENTSRELVNRRIP